ncbi:iron-sulfur cluster biosynthesis family protein [Bacillus kexueae]|uniref:iron-sulfur cluster biosynthesis family protein n=1 Tax=Aeribacillus kexueae TaxID=2078952 RepID=UPI001FAF3373|nr:iron-sulfur cluster biosynthesis family protein [Bacillus kexueae]
MNIIFTERAKEKMQENIQKHPNRFLKLKYDTEGCGCVVSGVTALWFVEELDWDDERIETNFVPIYVEKSKKVFLDEEMKIDFQESANTYMLISPGQILNPRMSCMVK